MKGPPPPLTTENTALLFAQLHIYTVFKREQAKKSFTQVRKKFLLVSCMKKVCRVLLCSVTIALHKKSCNAQLAGRKRLQTTASRVAARPDRVYRNCLLPAGCAPPPWRWPQPDSGDTTHHGACACAKLLRLSKVHHDNIVWLWRQIWSGFV